jgi:DNA-binding CsgD family transcriptional regulator
MKLTVILFYFLSGSVGIGTSWYCYRLSRKYRFNYLWSYFFYFISSTVYGFLNWVGPELAFLTLGHLKLELILPTIGLMGTLSIPFLLGRIYFLMKFTLELSNFPITPQLRKAFIFFTGIFSVISFWVIGKMVFSQVNGLDRILHFLIGLAAVGVHLYINVFLVFRAGKMPLKRDRRHLKILGLLFFGGFFIYTLSAYLIQGLIWGITPSAYLYFIILLPPLIYLGFHLKKTSPQSPYPADEKQKIELFVRRYRVTPREREILEMALQGKTNAEIEEALFIALQTVKNILSMIYKKVGVSTRVKLITLFTDFSSE